MALAKSVVLSVVASVVGTLVLRRLVSVAQPSGGLPQSDRHDPVNIFIIPVVIGNSGNHFREPSNARRPFPPKGRGRRS